MNDIEQQFFKAFGIEPIMLCDCEFKNLYDYRIEYGQDVCIYPDESTAKNPCLKCKLAKQIHPLYPEITAEKLLKIICLINTYDDRLLFKTSYDELKNEILKLAIETGTNEGVVNYQQFKQQVRSLFEEREC